MKEVYAVPDRHIRYAATKAFFSTKMTEGSSVREHGIKMLSLVKKLEDLQAGLDNNTQRSKSLSHRCWSGRLRPLRRKARGPDAGRGRRVRQRPLGSALSAPIAALGMGKGKGKVGSKSIRANDVCMHCREKGHWKRECPKLLSVQVLERSRKLSRDEVVLKLGDGKAIAVEAVGIVHLVVSDQVSIELKDCYYIPSMIKNIISISLLDNVGFEFMINKNCFYLMKSGSSHLLGKLHNGLYILQQHDLIMTAQNKRKMDNQENAQIWHARLDHISQDRIKRLVDSKSLEIDDLDHLPACESCVKGKMTKKPFVGQNMLASGLLDLIHSDVYGPLNTQTRGGFSYFVIFTDDHSRYGYVYLMRYKSETFGRFKKFRLEVQNQTGRKIKTLRSDRGLEYLTGEFLDYLKKIEFSLSGLLWKRHNLTASLKGGTEPCWTWFGP
ncbi:UNVERIFIED_CONTAM: hypothetical protein Slati_1686400 [Sesamum latifolium]|uniref:Uncharacterized protein n=1 Tax=Sesamum latifolium TaxID=2727402 RepID=A0AAW2WVB1_9LAMI